MCPYCCITLESFLAECVCVCGHLDIKNGSIVSIQRWGGRGPEKHLSSKPFLQMATLDMQGTIPWAKSEKVLASWVGHSAKRKERQRERPERGRWKREGKRGLYGEGGGGGVIKTYIIWGDFCYFCGYIISVNKLTFHSGLKDKDIKFKACVC